MSSIDVTLRISAEAFMRHYQGSARNVMALADDGRSLRFPTKILQPFRDTRRHQWSFPNIFRC